MQCYCRTRLNSKFRLKYQPFNCRTALVFSSYSLFCSTRKDKHVTDCLLQKNNAVLKTTHTHNVATLNIRFPGEICQCSSQTDHVRLITNVNIPLFHLIVLVLFLWVNKCPLIFERVVNTYIMLSKRVKICNRIKFSKKLKMAI